ncbi:hypothetical protein [Geodermatophilus sp. URMC 64]
MVPSSAPVCPLTVIAWRLGGIPQAALWWRYVDLGGDRPRDQLAAYLQGATSWPAPEHNLLAQALDERLWELGFPSLAPHRAIEGDRHGVGSPAEPEGNTAA